jgi:hypothetical protein
MKNNIIINIIQNEIYSRKRIFKYQEGNIKIRVENILEICKAKSI